MSQTPDLKSAYRQGIEDKDKAVYEMRKNLLNQPGAMPTKVDEIICAAMGFKSRSTVFFCVRRYKRKLKEQAPHEPEL